MKKRYSRQEVFIHFVPLNRPLESEVAPAAGGVCHFNVSSLL